MLWLMTLFGCQKIESGLNTRFEEIEQRYYSDLNTRKDRIFLHTIYRGGIFGGFFVVPYASRILRRCITGNPETLQLNSLYIKNRSPKIQATLKSLRDRPDGTYPFGGFRQAEDWKLSMAFNPYNVTINTSGTTRMVTVWYEFDWPEPEDAYDTVIPIGPMNIRLNDGLVHVISDCPTYRVEQSWELD